MRDRGEEAANDKSRISRFPVPLINEFIKITRSVLRLSRVARDSFRRRAGD